MVSHHGVRKSGRAIPTQTKKGPHVPKRTRSPPTSALPRLTRLHSCPAARVFDAQLEEEISGQFPGRQLRRLPG